MSRNYPPKRPPFDDYRQSPVERRDQTSMGRPPHGKHPAHNFRPGKNVGTAILLCVLVGGSVVTVVVVDIVIKAVLFSSTMVGLSQEKRTNLPPGIVVRPGSKGTVYMQAPRRTPVEIREKVEASNPDLWVLNADTVDLGTITVENKTTHEIATVSQEDALKGNISFQPPTSNNALGTGPHVLPSWIPDYPGSPAQWVKSLAWEKAVYEFGFAGSPGGYRYVRCYTGEFRFVTPDSFDQIAAN